MGDHVGVIYEVFDESGKMLRKQKKILFPETRKQMGLWCGVMVDILSVTCHMFIMHLGSFGQFLFPSYLVTGNKLCQKQIFRKQGGVLDFWSANEQPSSIEPVRHGSAGSMALSVRPVRCGSMPDTAHDNNDISFILNENEVFKVSVCNCLSVVCSF